MGESDLDDYPHLFLTTDGTAVIPTYPKAPLKWEPRGDRSEEIVKELCRPVPAPSEDPNAEKILES